MDIVLTDDAPDIAGGERWLLTLAKELVRRGHRVRVAPAAGSALADAVLTSPAGLRVLPVTYGRGHRQLASARALFGALRDDPPQLIHTTADTDRTAGALAARRLGARCVTSVHSCQSIQRNPFHWWRNRALIHHFLPVSHAGVDWLRRRDRLPASKVTVVPNGIDAARVAVSDPAEARARVRRELGIAADAFVGLSLGRLTRFKGHDILIRAVPAILREVPEAVFVLAGEGERRADLTAQIAALGGSEADAPVRLLGARDDVAALLAACDLVIHPSRDGGGEACPLAVIEAMAGGKPVVASAVADLPRMVGGDKNASASAGGDANATAGLLVPPEDPTALARAMIALARDADSRQRLGAAGRARFAARYTAAAMADAVEKVYRAVLGRLIPRAAPPPSR